MTDQILEKIEEKYKEIEKKVTITKYFDGEPQVGKFKVFTLAEDIKKSIRFITLRDTDEVYWYDEIEGIWKPNGETKIKEMARKFLGEFAKTHYINEVVNAIKETTYVDRNVFDSLPLEEIPVANGVLNWKTKELRPYKPEDYVTNKLPVVYNPEAKAETFNKFLREVVATELEVTTIKEIFAYCLYRDYPFQKAVMLVGDGSNGKSTLLQVLISFLGRENIAAVSLQDLEKNRFAAAQLYRKLANIYADLPSIALKNPGKFKVLTGGDYLTAEKKFKNPFSFRNYAKIIFSANQVPYVEDQSDAFYRRWIIINFPFKFVDDPKNPNEKKKDDHILEKLTTETELSGILNECLEILPRLIENGFTMKKPTEEIRKEYLRAASPVAAFVMECLIEDPDSYVPKEELYNAYCEYCRINKLPIRSSNLFHKELRKYIRVYEERKTIGGQRQRVYLGIKLIEPSEDVQDVQDVQAISILKSPGDNLHSFIEGDKGEKRNKETLENLNIKQPGHLGHPGQSIKESPRFIKINPVYGQCSYCGESKDLVWVDDNGNFLCNECRGEEYDK